MTTSPVQSITDEQIAEIEALANAVPHQTWRAGNAYGKAFILNYQVIADTPDGAYVLMEGNNNFPEDSVANAAYVGSAQPSTIRALISRLRAAEKDAGRYRHLVESGHFVPSSFGARWALRMAGEPSTKAELDAVVDTAMYEAKP